MTKKIAVVTTSRAEYGYLRPVIKALKEREEIDTYIIASGMHNFKEYGKTIEEIKKDFSNVINVEVKMPENSLLGNVSFFSESVIKTAEAIDKIKPDMAIFFGDRIEMFAATLAAVFQNIPIAHIHGGDKSSSGFDESIRHSISKFAHIHFPATEKSAERLIKMGEEKERIYLVGSPTIDEISLIKTPDILTLKQKYLLADKFAIVLQHPLTSNYKKAVEEIETTIETLKEKKINFIAICPNIDLGGQDMKKRLEEYKKEGYNVIDNLPREEYLGLLKNCVFLIGNSSSGIIEAASYKTPVINIGDRQLGRERSKNIIDVISDKEIILKSIEYVLNDFNFKENLRTLKNVYGGGEAGKKIAEIISKLSIDSIFLQKKITY